MLREIRQPSELLPPFPGGTAAQHIQVVDGVDYPPGQQRATSKDCEITSGKFEVSQELKQPMTEGGRFTG